MMMEEKQTLLKLLSLCIHYPDQTMVDVLPDIEKEAAGLTNPRTRKSLLCFTAFFRSQPLLKLQELYTALFDLNPETSLNLTYHLMGEREDRGRALAELIDIYRQAGFEPAADDLPDYLPLLLEFLTLAPESEHAPLISRCLAAISALAGRVRERSSMYAVPLEMVQEIFAETPNTPKPVEAGSIPSQREGNR
jgi:nitrate reductase delta subunit